EACHFQRRHQHAKIATALKKANAKGFSQVIDVNKVNETTSSVPPPSSAAVIPNDSDARPSLPSDLSPTSPTSS
ncbi:hypothetical protein EV182_001616, partial [Spiromyces aspiralis]